MASAKTIKSAIESMMFVWGDPLDIKAVADIFNIDRNEVYACCKELQAEYEAEGRGIVIREVNRSFQFVTRRENIDYIERLCTPVKHRKLSQSALEVLAIVAYKQPVTKAEIEQIRGVSCSHAINKLLEYGLITEAGRLNAPGRPILLATTEEFLRTFGVQSVEGLPSVSPEEMETLKTEAEEEVQMTLDV